MIFIPRNSRCNPCYRTLLIFWSSNHGSNMCKLSAFHAKLIHLIEKAWRTENILMIYEIFVSRTRVYYFENSGIIIFGLGLTKIWWDSPFSKVVSPGTHHFKTLVRTLINLCPPTIPRKCFSIGKHHTWLFGFLLGPWHLTLLILWYWRWRRTVFLLQGTNYCHCISHRAQ